jgi:hypothetical protein
MSCFCIIFDRIACSILMFACLNSNHKRLIKKTLISHSESNKKHGCCCTCRQAAATQKSSFKQQVSAQSSVASLFSQSHSQLHVVQHSGTSLIPTLRVGFPCFEESLLFACVPVTTMSSSRSGLGMSTPSHYAIVPGLGLCRVGRPNLASPRATRLGPGPLTPGSLA